METTRQRMEVVVVDSKISGLTQHEFINSEMLVDAKMTDLEFVTSMKLIMTYCKDDNETDISINNRLQRFMSLFDCVSNIYQIILLMY